MSSEQQALSQQGTVFLADLNQMRSSFEAALQQALSDDDLEAVRVDFLGRKGVLTEKLSVIRELPDQDRPLVGKAGNEIKKALTALLTARQQELLQEAAKQQQTDFDPAMPGRTPHAGTLHPVTCITEEICAVFSGMGFDIVTGPEIETDFYNFEALNLPPEHPARDMQDTLYIDEGIVLRTHTSPLQIRSMLERTPPVAVVAPGKVYRRDSDLTHTPMFNQIEGLFVDRSVSMADLRGTLTLFLQELFGTTTQVRFRPSFFPFTEPSAEVDITCCMCGGKGRIKGSVCRVCKETGWVEILGCGMVDPAVFEQVGYDPKQYTGFAFGLGIERIAMLRYGIGDLRMFFENDIRFLRQFTAS